MHIFYSVFAYFPAQAGGPTNSVYWMAKELIRRGHQITVVTTDLGLESGVKRNHWFKTDYGRVFYARTPVLYLPIRQTIRSLRSMKGSDIIHLNSLFFPSSYLLGLIKAIRGKKVILSVRGELDPAAMIYRPTLKKVMIWLLKQVAPKIHFHATCPEEAGYIQHYFPRTAGLLEIPNYLELPILQERKPEKYMLYIGRLHPKKGIDRLIEAIGISQALRTENYTLKIAGTAMMKGYQQQLEQQVQALNLSQSVVFLGQVEGHLKQQLYANAYATFMPSHSENFGNVVIESLAQGTPVVASTGTPWSILETYGAGFWVDNTPEALSRVIDQLLHLSPEVYAEYRTKALQLVQEQFDVESNVHRWEDQYQQIIAS